MSKISTFLSSTWAALIAVPSDLRIAITKILSKTQFHGKPFFLIYDLRGYKFNDTYTVLDILQPGDILLRTYDNYLTRLLIPGAWCHAAIAIDNKTIVNAVAQGVVITDTIQFCRTDKLCILRSNATPEQIQQIIALATSQIGKQYDYDFIAINNNKFYCSKLVQFCFAGICDLPDQPTILLGFIPGPSEITPNDIFTSPYLTVVYNSLLVQQPTI